MESVRLISHSSIPDDDFEEIPCSSETRSTIYLPQNVSYALGVHWKPFNRPVLSLKLPRIFRKPYPNRNRGRFYRLTVYLAISIACFIFLSLMNGLLRPSFSTPPRHYELLRQRVVSSAKPGRGNPNNEKVYIAANIINEQLIRGSWGQSVVELVDLLGPDNVFISIFENDSGVGTQTALQGLQNRFTCNSSVVTGGHLPLTSFPRMTLPNGRERVQRLTYLAEVRNRLLRPLDPAYNSDQTPGFRSASHIRFSKIFFLNDVYFSPLSAVQLLFSTNSDPDDYNSTRSRYRAACSIDFVRAVMFYDSFVVRDSEGFGMGLMFYPFFATSGKGTSRSDVRQQKDSVRVRSCWGGMAAFDATIFQSSTPGNSSLSGLNVQFRGSNESFWEAAECCLLFADTEAQFGLPDYHNGTGVFINPYIRVAYTSTTWAWLPFFQRYERMFEYLQYIVSTIGYPEFNPRRNHEGGELVQERVWVSDTRLAENGSFELVTRTARPGGFCGQRRMFVMKENLEDANIKGMGKNWQKIPVPTGWWK